MKLNNFRSENYLTSTQRLMIKACLATAKGDKEEALRLWEKEVNIDDLDFSSSRLIPYFLHENQKMGIISIHDKRLKIIYKHWWLRTKHINHELKKVCETLFNGGVDVTVIKGASIMDYYDLEELRCMADFDILVPRKDVFKALDLIKQIDYLPVNYENKLLEKSEKQFFENFHSTCCIQQKNQTNLDLHWRVGSLSSAKFTDDFWLHLENYEKIPHAKKPQVAYEVFLIIIHAVTFFSRDNLNWIIDIATINKKAGHSFWEEARVLSIKEKKEDLFDYGCSVLLSFGIYALTPKKVKIPWNLVPNEGNNRDHIGFLNLFYLKAKNLISVVNRQYHDQSFFGKIYQVAKRVEFSFKTRKIIP
ncbi:hypothetical protein EZJ43_08245 [Pedobacter changchengzhani]|uniref:Nucleotidyltransferase family protein n=1 Tax=Pedobacter changchengzhani TaxID=2529274 RepID=A0A4R5MLI7_9SPHI|nr:nucleotidyltransferase family protein [Pedobacter changchengzhani]TDG36498.1 hypothetical protein EZJ43_08245 [Pedobacter changchengzhani]